MNNEQDLTSVIPAAHMERAMQAAAGRKLQGNDAALLQQLQKQLNYLMGVTGSAEQRPDVIMVNPHGRIIEVSGQYVDEWIQKPGFRKATPEEESNYHKAMLLQTPEYLRRKEQKRLVEQQQLLDEIESMDHDKMKPEDLLRTKVTDAQRTNAPTPDQVKAAISDTNDAADSKDQHADKLPPKRGAERRAQPDSSDVEDV